MAPSKSSSVRSAGSATEGYTHSSFGAATSAVQLAVGSYSCSQTLLQYTVDVLVEQQHAYSASSSMIIKHLRGAT